MVTVATIAAGLRRLGLRRGDSVVAHSSLSSFGTVQGGAYAVIDALMEVVGPCGTILLPTFNHGREEVFDSATSPSYTGRITETFRHVEGVLRGSHPTHSFAAWGAAARRYLKDDHRQRTWGPESPLGRLIADGGWVLLLGVTQKSSTAQHHGEIAAGVKCIICDAAAAWTMDDEGEKVATVAPSWRNGVCPYTWQMQDASLRELGAVRDGHIGAAHVQLMRGSEAVEGVARLVRGETGVDLCAQCELRPRLVTDPGMPWRPRQPRPPSGWSPRPDAGDVRGM